VDECEKNNGKGELRVRGGIRGGKMAGKRGQRRRTQKFLIPARTWFSITKKGCTKSPNPAIGKTLKDIKNGEKDKTRNS